MKVTVRFIAVLVLLTLLGLACHRPYSHHAYKNHDEEQLFAMICHNGKRTIRIPAEEWKEHKAHGDYRGPCRERRIAGSSKQPAQSNQTAISYSGNKSRLKENREQWEAYEAAKFRAQDSLKASLLEANQGNQNGQ